MENQRIRLTKKLLAEALLDLLATKPIEKISIQQLSNKAGVNRSTFYLHYPDIYHLLEEIENHLVDDVKHYLKIQTNSKQSNIRNLLDYIVNKKKVFSVLLINCESSRFNEMFLNISSEIMESELRLKLPERYRSYVIEYLLKANNALIFKWIRDDFNLSIEDLTMIMTSLSKSVVNTTLQ